MQRSLVGKVVVITGGARGIGAETARALAAEGARVVVGDLDLALAEQLVAGFDQALALHLDVTDHSGFTAFLDEVERHYGRIDVLINNAGIMPLSSLEDETDASTSRTIEINLAAVIHGTREAIRRMKPRGSGHIVNIASMAGKVGIPSGATYCATKHAVVGLSEAVSLELRGTGVDVSIVMPTIVRTELAAGLRDTRLSAMIEPKDVAAAIVGALRKPRLEVYVPGYLGPLSRFTRMLPRRAVEFVGRISGAEKALSTGLNSPARGAYEARAAASAPAAEGEHAHAPSPAQGGAA